jgi:hypothetical protein
MTGETALQQPAAIKIINMEWIAVVTKERFCGLYCLSITGRCAWQQHNNQVASRHWCQSKIASVRHIQLESPRT